MICGNCGKANRPAFVPPPAETAPDLDLRPGEPTRSTLRRWVSNCAGCGATAPDLSQLTPAAHAVIDQPAYRNQLNPFLRWAMLCPHDPEAWLEGAWFEDDRGDAEAARAARRGAIQVWGQPADTSAALRLLDVMRRTGLLGEAAALAAQIEARPLDETSAQILAFQQARIAAGDTGRHLMSSALRPPARTPHVAYTAKRQVGFWRRLLGGGA